MFSAQLSNTAFNLPATDCFMYHKIHMPSSIFPLLVYFNILIFFVIRNIFKDRFLFSNYLERSEEFMCSLSKLCRGLGKSLHGPCNLMSQNGERKGLIREEGRIKKVDCQWGGGEGVIERRGLIELSQ